MRIFSKYVFRQAAGSFLLILFSLTGIVWIALALRQFNVVTTQGQDTWMLVKMTSLAIPNLMAIIAPFSFLIAALHTLNRLNTDSELIVLSAAGSKVWTVGRPLLLLGTSCQLVPRLHKSSRAALEHAIVARLHRAGPQRPPHPGYPAGPLLEPEPDLIFHIRDREANGELDGLVMHDTRQGSVAKLYRRARNDRETGWHGLPCHVGWSHHPQDGCQRTTANCGFRQIRRRPRSFRAAG